MKWTQDAYLLPHQANLWKPGNWRSWSSALSGGHCQWYCRRFQWLNSEAEVCVESKTCSAAQQHQNRVIWPSDVRIGHENVFRLLTKLSPMYLPQHDQSFVFFKSETKSECWFLWLEFDFNRTIFLNLHFHVASSRWPAHNSQVQSQKNQNKVFEPSLLLTEYSVIIYVRGFSNNLSTSAW